MASKTIVVPSNEAGTQPSTTTLMASIADLKEEIEALKGKQKVQMVLLVIVVLAAAGSMAALHVL